MAKNFYDVDICKAAGNPEDEDWETIYFESADSYSEAIARAKELSMLKEWNGIPVFEAHVVCFQHTPETDFDQLYIRAYRNGKFIDQF